MPHVWLGDIDFHKYDNPCLLCMKSSDLKTCIYGLYAIQISIKIRPLHANPLHKYDKCYWPYIKRRSEDASLHLVYIFDNMGLPTMRIVPIIPSKPCIWYLYVLFDL